MLLRTCSVHGFGMREPLWVVSLDPGGRVRRVGLLLPRRVLWDPGAAWTIELPLSRRPPEPGMGLRVVWRPASAAGEESVCWHT